MKRIAFVLCLLFSCKAVLSQCGKPVRIECNKGYNIKNGAQQEAYDISAFIDIKKDEITITATFRGETEVVHNKIKSIPLCRWNKFMVDGKAEYRVTSSSDEKPGVQESVIIIETYEGELSVSFFEEGKPDVGIQFIASRFEEL